MRTINYTTARQNLARTMDEIIEAREEVIVTRGDKAVVMMSLDEFNGWMETIHLLRSPDNAEHLLRSIAALEEGRGIAVELVE